LEALKVVEPRLKKLSMAVVGGNPIIHGDIGVDRLMPLPLMGDEPLKTSKHVFFLFLNHDLIF